MTALDSDVEAIRMFYESKTVVCADFAPNSRAIEFDTENFELAGTSYHAQYGGREVLVNVIRYEVLSVGLLRVWLDMESMVMM